MTSAQFPVIETIAPPSRERFDKEIRPAAKPVIMRGIAKGWPAVEQAMKGVVPLFQYLSAMDTGQSQGTLVKKTEEREKFFYSDDLRTQNYETVSETASVALENLLSPPDNKTRYIQSVKLDDHFSDVIGGRCDLYSLRMVASCAGFGTAKYARQLLVVTSNRTAR